MWALAGLAGLAAFVVLVLHFASWLGREWFVFFAAAVVLSYTALHLHHRRRIAEIYELHAKVTGRHRRLHPFLPWPKVCNDCGQEAHHLTQITAHNDAETSPCARLAADRDRAALAPPDAPMDVDQLREPVAPGPAAADPPPDTIHAPPAEATVIREVDDGQADDDGPPPEVTIEQLQARADRRAAAWAKIDALAAQVTRRGSR